MDIYIYIYICIYIYIYTDTYTYTYHSYKRNNTLMRSSGKYNCKYNFLLKVFCM